MKTVATFFCCLLPFLVLSQRFYEEEGFFWGLKAGANYASIDGIGSTLISPIYPADTYTTNTTHQVGGTAALFFDYRFPYSRMGTRVELSYSMLGGGFSYSDVEGLEYDLRFDYEYFNFTPALKLNFPADWSYLIAGAQFGVNLSPEKIFYDSNDETPNLDLQVQQSLREVLKGQSNFGLLFGIGGELFENRLSIEARYLLGIKDVIETQANSFFFEEFSNRITAIEVSVGWATHFN